jgi:hypothetical protein
MDLEDVGSLPIQAAVSSGLLGIPTSFFRDETGWADRSLRAEGKAFLSICQLAVFAALRSMALMSVRSLEGIAGPEGIPGPLFRLK